MKSIIKNMKNIFWLMKPTWKYGTEYVKDIPSEHPDVNRAIETLTEVFKLKKISDVYGYVRGLQENMDLSQIKFSKEYYEIVGE